MSNQISEFVKRHQKPILYSLLFWNGVFLVLVMTPGKICMALNAALGSKYHALAGVAVVANMIWIVTEICMESRPTILARWRLLALIMFAEIVFVAAVSLVPSNVIWNMLPKSEMEK